MKKRIVVEAFGTHPRFRRFHVTVSVCNTKPEAGFVVPLESPQELQEKLGDVGAAVVSALAHCEGVDYISLDHYSISVEIGAAFEWEQEILDPIIAVIRKAVYNDAPDVELVQR